jgi:hypothetical protein
MSPVDCALVIRFAVHFASFVILNSERDFQPCDALRFRSIPIPPVLPKDPEANWQASHRLFVANSCVWEYLPAKSNS